MSNNSFPHESFDDLLAANAEYQKTFKYSGLTGSAAKGLAIVTCMDSRINPLSVIESAMCHRVKEFRSARYAAFRGD